MSAEPAAAPDDTLPAARVYAWLRERRPAAQAPLEASLIVGGRSNLTYLLTDRLGQRWVLRRPPLSGVIASAHDVLREHRIMSAMAGTGVPVPVMAGACEDESVIGAPFFVMDYVDGIVLRDLETAQQCLGEPARGVVGDSMIDALGALHGVPAAGVGLGDLGGSARGQDYIGRQLDRWELQLQRLDVPMSAGMRDVLTRLRAAVPPQREVTLVHGDFRPGNTIVGTDGTVRAVLDWELATVGDPLADLGWLLAYWGDPGKPPLPLSVPTRAAGFARPERLAERYCQLTGRSVDDLGFYLAFALWRVAAIISGVNARVARNAYGSAGPAMAAQLGDQRVADLVSAAADAATAAGR